MYPTLFTRSTSQSTSANYLLPAIFFLSFFFICYVHQCTKYTRNTDFPLSQCRKYNELTGIHKTQAYCILRLRYFFSLCQANKQGKTMMITALFVNLSRARSHFFPPAIEGEKWKSYIVVIFFFV